MWGINNMEKIYYLIIGWFLGILHIVLYEQYKRCLCRKSFKTAILTELKELLPRLVVSYYYLNIELRELDKKKLQWIYNGLLTNEDETTKSVKEGIKKQLEYANDDIKKISFGDITGIKSEVIHIKSIILSFDKENTINFSLLNKKLRLKIFEVRTKINYLNELADRNNFFFKQTFVPDLSNVNHKIIRSNINNNYKEYLMHSKVVVERIQEIFELEKKHK
jgi:hypothetical protein